MIFDHLDEAEHARNNIVAETIEDTKPSRWTTFGNASYEAHDDSIVMRGPNYIFVEIDCKPATETEFSINVDHAGVANMQLQFFTVGGTAISEPAIQDISGMVRKIAKVRAIAPAGTSKVRVLMYSPQSGDAVIFMNPTVRMRYRAKL